MKKRKLSSDAVFYDSMADLLTDATDHLSYNDERDNLLFQSSASIAQKKWKNIAIISHNNIAIHGVRAIFRNILPFRIRIFNDVESVKRNILDAKDFVPDVLVWVDSKSEFLHGMATLTVQISRKLPSVQQLILSECIPSGLRILPRGVRVASLDTSVTQLTRIMKACLVPPETTGKLFSEKFMTSGQWRIIRLLVQGRTAKEVAEEICLSPKTVWGREEEVMRQLNLQGHTQKAWFYRIVVELLTAIPAFGRLS